MSAVPVAQRMTADEFLSLPDTDDLRSAELVQGELIVDPPRARHQLVEGEILYAPHLAFEIRAPSTWRYDLELTDLLTSLQLDGFELPPVELFPE
jgi:Uma2 family endonuclease